MTIGPSEADSRQERRLLPPLANRWILPLLLLSVAVSGSFAAVQLAPWFEAAFNKLGAGDDQTNEQQALENATNNLDDMTSATENMGELANLGTEMIDSASVETNAK